MYKRKINTFDYPYFAGIGYQDELVIFINEGIVQQQEVDVEIIDGKSISGCPIEVNEQSERIEIRFDGIFSYHVLDESYGSFPKYEETIDQLRSDYHAQDSVIHYEIVTEDVIINVVSSSEPKIKKLKNENT